MLFLQKRLGLSYVLYLFAKKYFPRTFQEMSSFLIITQKRRHFSSFFPPELGRYTYLGTLLKVDYADQVYFASHTHTYMLQEVSTIGILRQQSYIVETRKCVTRAEYTHFYNSVEKVLMQIITRVLCENVVGSQEIQNMQYYVVSA